MFIKFLTIILSVLFFSEKGYSSANTPDTEINNAPSLPIANSVTPLCAIAVSQPSAITTPITTINYQGTDVAISSILAFGNQLIKGQTPSSLKITAAVFQSISDTLGYFNTSLAHGNINQFTDLPVLENLLKNLLLASHKDINILLSFVPKEDQPMVQAALTAASTIASASIDLADGGKITPSGCFSCILGTTLTIAQQLAAQQAAQMAAQNQPIS